jgi:hypothetical protein
MVDMGDDGDVANFGRILYVLHAIKMALKQRRAFSL